MSFLDGDGVIILVSETPLHHFTYIGTFGLGLDA